MDTKLARKLLISPQKRILVVGAPSTFKNTLDQSKPSVDVIVVFVKNKEGVSKACRTVFSHLAPNGVLWFAYPKKSSGNATNITRDEGWEELTKKKYLPVTQIAIDETWSALRFKPMDQIAKLTRQSLVPSTQQRTERQLELPTAFAQLLSKNKNASAFFQSLSYTNRKEYIVWLTTAKKIETQQKRLDAALEKLLSGKKNPSEK